MKIQPTNRIYTNGENYIVLRGKHYVGPFATRQEAVENCNKHLPKQQTKRYPEPPEPGQPQYSGINWANHPQRWVIRVSANGNQASLGTYYTQEDAIAAYTELMGKPPVKSSRKMHRELGTPPTADTVPHKGIQWLPHRSRWEALSYSRETGTIRVGNFLTQAEAIKAKALTDKIFKANRPEPFPKDETELPTIEDLL